MKNNYKYRIDEPGPSEESMARHKNFDRILADYRHMTEPMYNRPLYKNPRVFIGLVLILVIGFLVFEAVKEEKEIAEKEKIAELPEEIRYAERNAFLQPPLEALQPKLWKLSLTADKGSEAITESGITVQIPEGALVDEAGQPVKGQFELEIQDIASPLDMVLRGIPQQLQGVEGKPVLLESGGVVDIRLSQDGKPLQVAPGKTVEVGLPVRDGQAADLAVYRLDTRLQSWVRTDLPATTVNVTAEMAAKLGGPDGLEVMEMDENGNLIRKDVARDEGPEIKRWKVNAFELEKMGLVGLHRELPGGSLEAARVEVKDAQGQPLKLAVMYVLPRNQRFLGTFWPQDRDYGFTLQVLPKADMVLFGFTTDGDLAIVDAASSAALQPGTGKPEQLTARVYTEEIQTIDDLKQLLGL